MRGMRFLAACRGEPVDRPPVWVMRQAGRYLPEYLRTREQAGSFLALCRNPELAAEVTLQPVRRFGFDAAIIFSDILLPLSTLGVQFEFPDEGGPRLAAPLAGPQHWERLRTDRDGGDTGLVADAVARVRAALPDEVALIGFCGAPWTLASYLIEGSTSRDYARAKAALLEHPRECSALLALLAEAMAAYLESLVRAGADAVQVFDSWAGTLPAPLYSEYAVPPVASLMHRLADTGVPRILYAGGASHLLPKIAEVPCEVVGVDWRIPLLTAATALPGRAVQGNLDPATLLASPGTVSQATRRMMAEAPSSGWVANLGHGILPDTPVACVQAFIDTVRGRA